MGGESPDITAPATPEAASWSGWGTALKPGHEPICVARKPLAGTVEANVRRHGTGAINVDGCRIGDEVRRNAPAGNKPGGLSLNMSTRGMPVDADGRDAVGRWPANVVIDEEVAAMIDAQSGIQKDGVAVKRNTAIGKMTGHIFRMGNTGEDVGYGGEGGASRFFYVAKASGNDRGEENIHETVKPLSLMRWLVRLVTPPGGLVLDPFAGSGTTGLAAMAEGMSAILVERESDYVAVIKSRLAGACEVVEGDGRREETPRKRKKREQISLFG